MAAFGVVVFAVLLLFAIFFHELGHYVTAKWSGIKVRAFFVGFGPTLWSFRRGQTERVEDPRTGEPVERPETEYGVKLLPLGGFVKVVGMSPFEEIPPEDQPRSFDAAPHWKRAVVLSAGSVTHFVTAFIILLLVFTVVGIPAGEATLRIAAIEREVAGETSPALQAGLEPGDEVVAVDGEPMESWDEFRRTVMTSPGKTLQVTVRTSSGELERRRLTPATIREGPDAPFGMIGVAPEAETITLGPVEGVVESGTYIGRLVAGFAQFAPDAFSPRNLGLVPGEEPGAERAVSVIGAGRIAGGLAARGQVAEFMLLFVMINVFIGLFNLLPLPPLDGGHLILLGIDKARGKPVHPRLALTVMAVGMTLLLLLAFLILFQDIVNPIDPFRQ